MRPYVTGAQMRAILKDQFADGWFEFFDCTQTIEVQQPSDFLPALEQIERWVDAGQGWAAGWVNYEAATACDAKLPVQSSERPLAVFGLFRSRAASSGCFEQPIAASGGWQLQGQANHYRDHVGRILAGIGAGDFYQVNFSERCVGQVDDPYLLFLKLCQQAEYGAYLATDSQAIVSASPELFFAKHGDQLRCKPMKGTALRGGCREEDEQQRSWLQASAKNRAENLMIVDMVRNDLSRIAQIGSVQVSELYQVETHPYVLQMTSTVEACSDASIAQIFRALFPAASITGAPKRAAMDYIATHETAPRGAYCGAIGFIGPHYTQFNVGIRTVEVSRNTGKACYGVGGGIVADSKPDEEYDELLSKASTIAPDKHFKLLETLRLEDGMVLRQNRHLARLQRAAARFGFPLDQPAVIQALELTAKDYRQGLFRLRLLVDKLGGVECQVSALRDVADQVQDMHLVALPTDACSPFVSYKTTRRHHYDVAQRQAGDAEALLFNAAGQVTESVIANVVFRLHGQLYTPPVSDGLLDGVLRSELVAQGDVLERSLDLTELDQVEQWYLVNSLRGWRQARLLTR